jgi:hypothetical protein
MSQNSMQKTPKYVKREQAFKQDRRISSSEDLGTDALTQRLDIIIRLLMDAQRSYSKIKKKDQIVMLDSFGLTDNEIGNIIGWSRRDVGSELSKVRRSKKQ